MLFFLFKPKKMCYTNLDKRTIVTFIRDEYGNEFKGQSYCSVDDEFDEVDEMMSDSASMLTCISDMKSPTKVIGRETEIEATLEVLCRKENNNVIHVGESGVGKTTVASIIAKATNRKLCKLNGTNASIADIRKALTCSEGSVLIRFLRQGKEKTLRAQMSPLSTETKITFSTTKSSS